MTIENTCSAPQGRTMSPPTLLHSHTPNLPSPLVTLFTPQHRRRTTNLLFPLQNLTPPFSFSVVTTTTTTLSPSSLSFSSPHLQPQEIDDDDDDDEFVVGDYVVFEDGAFEDPYLQPGSVSSRRRRKNKSDTEPQDLVPESWKKVVEEINMTKKERRRIAQELEFGSRVVKKKRLESAPPRNVNVEVFNRYKETKLSQLRPIVLDSPTFTAPDLRKSEEPRPPSDGSRVAPKDPRWAAYGGTMDDITDFFNSEKYEPRRVAAATEGGKLFTKEETLLLNARIPDLQGASSSKWLPLHTLAASGEFYLMDALLKHNVDINGADKDGLTALHRAIICKKQAIMNYLLRESANPFVLDKEGASLMHYAVRTASVPAIKVLLLYNVDINLQDSDGWTPLHLAVQSQRTDIVRLLLIKGADETIKNVEGLTPLELCLYSGHDVFTYQLIKLLKQPPRPSTLGLPQIPVRSWKLPQSPVRNWKAPQSTVRNRKLPQRPLRNRGLRSPPKGVRNRRRG